MAKAALIVCHRVSLRESVRMQDVCHYALAQTSQQVGCDSCSRPYQLSVQQGRDLPKPNLLWGRLKALGGSQRGVFLPQGIQVAAGGPKPSAGLPGHHIVLMAAQLKSMQDSALASRSDREPPTAEQLKQIDADIQKFRGQYDAVGAGLHTLNDKTSNIKALAQQQVRIPNPLTCHTECSNLTSVNPAASRYPALGYQHCI